MTVTARARVKVKVRGPGRFPRGRWPRRLFSEAWSGTRDLHRDMTLTRHVYIAVRRRLLYRPVLALPKPI